MYIFDCDKCRSRKIQLNKKHHQQPKTDDKFSDGNQLLQDETSESNSVNVIPT